MLDNRFDTQVMLYYHMMTFLKKIKIWHNYRLSSISILPSSILFGDEGGIEEGGATASLLESLVILYLSFCRQSSCLFYQGQSSCGVATTTGPGLSDLAAVSLGSVLLHFLKSVVLVACLRNDAFDNVKVWVSNPILECCILMASIWYCTISPMVDTSLTT